MAQRTDRTAASGNGTTRSSSSGTNGISAVDRAVGLLTVPVTTARRVLPDRELPVYLGIGALAVAGAIEWPFAAAAGLTYAAVKRWGPGAGQSGRS